MFRYRDDEHKGKLIELDSLNFYLWNDSRGLLSFDRFQLNLSLALRILSLSVYNSLSDEGNSIFKLFL